mmetsp:Transcript_14921/g.60854  ORF Transcript_14921/g.60854 Transcript_14921/m.60854 type:complete len:208 (-) Transcript_14921:1485-2108(-)
MYKVEKSIHCLRRDIILCYSSDDGAHNCRQMTITAPLNVVLDQEVNDTRFAANGLVRRIRPNKVSQHSEDSQFQLQICVLQAHPYQEPQGLGMGNSQALRTTSAFLKGHSTRIAKLVSKDHPPTSAYSPWDPIRDSNVRVSSERMIARILSRLVMRILGNAHSKLSLSFSQSTKSDSSPCLLAIAPIVLRISETTLILSSSSCRYSF